MLEDSIKKQILCIIAEASMQDGWAKQAVVCSECLKQGIDLKIYVFGMSKTRHRS